MTELEKMQRARRYLYELAQGTDPISQNPVQDDSVLQNVRIVRCLYYVIEVLDRVIDNGGEVVHRSGGRKPDFVLPPELRELIPLSAKPIAISELVTRINDTVDDDSRKKLTIKPITEWLVAQGFLASIPIGEGKTKKGLTDLSEQVGITMETRTSLTHGDYQVILYLREGQQFVLDNLDTILDWWASRSTITHLP